MSIWFGLFLVSVGCCLGYLLASMVFAGKLEDEKRRIAWEAAQRLRKYQDER